MANRRNPFIDIGFSEYAGVHLMPFGIEERAQTHEINRQRVVASIILDLHFMTIKRFIEENSIVTYRGAISQSLEGHAGNQAAHCAPRQIYVNGRAIQHAMQHRYPERAFALDALFAETDILPANFNKCDSRIERNGLSEAFRAACEHAIRRAYQVAEFDRGLITMAATGAYAIYKQGAATAMTMSRQRLKDKLSASGVSHRDRVNWGEQLFITENYIDALHLSEGRDRGISQDKITGLMKVYSEE
jgi:hypothetical protein